MIRIFRYSGSIFMILMLSAGCASAPLYHEGPGTGSTRESPGSEAGAPETPGRPSNRPAASGRVPDGPRRWGDHYLRGLSSWYGRDFHGKKTANGEIFNMYKLTAAHRTLPLGTKARIWNVENGRSCIVIINDRGPFIEGRILDLSYAAALELEMALQGVAEIQIEIIKLPDGSPEAFE
ncbi:septal ring lytic transglycosylase RlpA family protein [Gemmatimonadota bacterium]